MSPADRTALKLIAGAVLWIVAFLGLAGAMAACHPVDDSGTDHDTRPNACADNSHTVACDGDG